MIFFGWIGLQCFASQTRCTFINIQFFPPPTSTGAEKIRSDFGGTTFSWYKCQIIHLAYQSHVSLKFIFELTPLTCQHSTTKHQNQPKPPAGKNLSAHQNEHPHKCENDSRVIIIHFVFFHDFLHPTKLHEKITFARKFPTHLRLSFCSQHKFLHYNGSRMLVLVDHSKTRENNQVPNYSRKTIHE